MKKTLSLLLALCLFLQLAACGSPAPAAPGSDHPVAQAVSFRSYDYSYGGFSVSIPSSLPNDPTDLGDSLLFTDPEGEWTLRFLPLTLRSVSNQNYKLSNLMEEFRGFGYYQDVKTEELPFGAFTARRYSFSRNPDWVEASQGYTLSFTEPHAITVVDYGDMVIGQWGGLLMDLSAPEKSLADLNAILADPDVQALLGNLVFQEGSRSLTASIPGISVEFPVRWTPGNNGTDTVWAGITGEHSGTVFIGTSIYADPAQAAALIRPDVRTVEYGGVTYCGGVRHSVLSDTAIDTLELYTSFSEHHALQVKLSLSGADEEALWAFAESEEFREVMGSLELDPAAFHEPEADRIDAEGFVCNNINEISAYNGSGSDVTVPAVVGTNEILGINYGVFQNNTDLRRITISEGIRYIEADAFKGCTNLETVVLPNSLTLIDSGAFEGCTALRTVQFGNGLIEIGSEAFYECAALEDVLLPGTVAKIDYGAFLGAGSGQGRFSCPAEGTVYADLCLCRAQFDSVEIGPMADLSARNILSEALVRRVVIGEGCQELGENFLACPVYTDAAGMWHYYDTPLAISFSGIRKIGNYAFRGRLGLQEVNLTGVQELGTGSFESTGLVNIVVPGTVKEVPENCFGNCPAVLSITLEEGVEQVGRYAFSSCGRIYRSKWSFQHLTKEEAASFGDRAIPNGSPDYDRFVNIILPSTLKWADDCSFSALFLEGLYMLWCTGPEMLPDFHKDAFSGCYIYQFYFTEETIEQYGDALDNALSALEDVGTPAWYDTGERAPYWSEDPLQ